ncbi:Platinum sensitivity protein [Serendipita sp. 407]|nr:Platinum sensitivity protein [Serendipita sp. 407]
MLTSPKHELSLKSQLAESFRTLMDVPGLDSTLQGLKILQPQQPVRKEDQQSDRFLDYFYHRCAGDLYKPMLDHVPEHSNVKSYPLELTRAQSDLYLYLCDLLSGFLLQHSYQSHFFVTTNSLAPRIAALLYAREKHLRLAALRFFRTCLRLNNNNVLNHLIKHNIFSPILELTKRESSRDNLLSSCCQEFFEHLRRENYKDVISHIMKGHDALVRQLATSLIVGQRFQGLIQRWDMNNEPPPRQEPKPVQLPMKRWAPTRAIDAEDDYFNAEEETPAAGRQTRGQGRKRGMPNAAGGVTPGNRRPQRPVNVALPRAYPIGTALVDYQEEDETPSGAALTEMPPKTAKSGRLLHQQQPQSQEGPPLRGRNRRPDLARTASLIQMDPTSTAGTASTSASTSSASHAPAAGSPSATTTTAAGGSDQPVTIAASRRGSMSASAASEIGPVAMEEDDDLIGPPVSLSLSHKRRRGLDEEDETMERLAKRPALGTSSSPERSPTRSGPGSSGGASAGGGANGPSTTTTSGSPSGSQEASSSESTSHEPTPTTTSRSSKRQLRVKLGNAAMLSSQPPDVKVGDKG